MTVRSRNLIFVLIVVAASFGIGKMLFSQSKSVPVEFFQSRAESGRLAEKITSFLTNSLDRLDQVAQYDKVGRIQEAIKIIEGQVSSAKENDLNSLLLATQLETLARAAQTIRPDQARQIAVEAVSNEVALVSRMIVYNTELKDLFQLLNEKFTGQRAAKSQEVQNLILQLNDLANGINDLNYKFNNGMKQLDEGF